MTAVYLFYTAANGGFIKILRMTIFQQEKYFLTNVIIDGIKIYKGKLLAQ